MATDRQQPTRGDYPRVCDICGHRFMFSELRPIGELRWACPDDAPGLTANQISRFNARAKPLIVRPRKYAKDYIQTPIYQLSEAQIFNFIASTAPAGEPNGSSDALSAAWAAIYMADVVAQDKRPLNWERTAVRTLTRCCDYLLTLQYGAPTSANPTGTADNPRYGGILSGTVRSTAITIAAGAAFIKAYMQTGSATYFGAAQRCATFLRHAQSGNVQATAYTVYPSGGGAYYIGGLASSLNESTGLLSATYLVADVAGAWFLKLLADVQGDTTAYGDAAATAFFTAPTRATLATMIADLTAFGETGARDSSSGLTVAGLSPTAPKLQYGAALNGAGGAAAWATAAQITAHDFALALLGIYTANGTTAKVTEMMAWLASFTSNAANRTPATLREDLVVEGITGTYDPTLCPADSLQTAAPFTEAYQALYDWASFGILSPILAADQTALRRSKDTLSTSVRYSFYDIENKWLGPIGSSGLSLQPIYRNSSGHLIGPAGTGASTSVTPPSTGLVFWVKGDAGLTTAGPLVTAWADQSGMGQHLSSPGGFEPSSGIDTIDGIPCVTFSNTNAIQAQYMARSGFSMLNRNSAPFTFAQPRTVMAAILPKYSAGAFGITGGPVFMFAEAPLFQCLFDLEDTFAVNAFYAWSSAWRDLATARRAPDEAGGAAGIYNNVPTLGEWRSSGNPNLAFAVNGVDKTLTPTGQYGATGPTPNQGFYLGTWGAGVGLHFLGAIAEVLVWDYDLTTNPTAHAQAIAYYQSRFPSIGLGPGSTTSVVRAARTGMVYRQNPGRYPGLRGN